MREAARQRGATELPTGTVTFLFSDIEGSTGLLRQLGEGYVAVVGEHHGILRNAVKEQGGREIDNQGDSFFFAFERANAAVAAAVLAQRALSEHAWPEGGEVRVRMGLHTGEPILGAARYVGLGVHRAARIGAVAHGGQVIISKATRELVEEGLSGVSIRDLGVYRLKDIERDERLYQLDVAGLRSDFPALNAPRVAEPLATCQSEMEIGAEFLGYRIEELIGQGGMGVVYRAYDLRLKRTVALKLVMPELAVDERFRERFARETELAMALEHPNVVPVHDAGEVAGRLYLAMRLVDGTDLRKLLRSEGELEPARALAICRQVANALDSAHARGLVHRDVKPSNVLLDENEHVYLADFGLTRRLEEQAAPAGEGRSIGTPAYLAPEQIEGKPVDGRADVYSLGCLLFECLAGQVPFRRDSRLALAWAHLEDEPPSATECNPKLPEAIDAVIGTAMAKEPEDRYPTSAALIAAAEEALGFRQAPFHRRRAVRLLAATFLILAASLPALLLTRGGGGSAGASRYAQANTLARIDPATNSVSAVIGVDDSPAAIAVGGRTVWVYGGADKTISEIDAATNKVRHVTAIAAPPKYLGHFQGPILAADPESAWIVGIDKHGGPFLTRVLSGGRGARQYRLDQEPVAIGVGYGSVWVLGRATFDNQILRVDPSTGRITARTSLPAPIDSLEIGYGAVWVVGSSSGMLYRIDPRSTQRTGDVIVGELAARPWAVFGSVWVGLEDDGGKTAIVDPRTMTVVGKLDCCPPDWGERGVAYGSLWRYDWPTGSVLRQDSQGRLLHSTRVVEAAPVSGGPCLTSFASGAGGIWVSVSRKGNGGSCGRGDGSTPPLGTDAERKQQVRITTRDRFFGFVLAPVGPGPLERDSGWVSYGPYSEAFITREGLPVEVNELDVTLEGKRGRLVFHHRIEWFDSGNGYGIGFFRWRIVRGTGAYAGLQGGGRGATTWLPSGPVSGHWEGFVYPKQ
jgi:class 3 adenylate cyclase